MVVLLHFETKVSHFLHHPVEKPVEKESLLIGLSNFSIPENEMSVSRMFEFRRKTFLSRNSNFQHSHLSSRTLICPLSDLGSSTSGYEKSYCCKE